MKKIASSARGLVRNVKKIYKKVTDSKIGKALLVAATVYVGGAMLGAWNSPFSSINGVLAKGGGAAAESSASSFLSAGGEAAATAAPTGFTPASAAATTSTGSGTVNLGSVVGSGSGAGASTTASNIAAGTGAGAGAGAGTTAAGFGSPAVAESARLSGQVAQMAGKTAAEETTKGMLAKAMGKAGEAASKTGSWMKENPMTSYMGFNAVSSALSPDEAELMEEQSRILAEREDTERARRERNLAVAGIDLGISPTGKSLVDLSGNEVYTNSGMINRARYS